MANTSKSIHWSFNHVASKVFYFANTIPVKPLGDAIPTYSSRAIWDASFKGFCQEALPEVIRYYRKRDCPPRASTPGKFLCDLFSALLFVVDPCGIFMVYCVDIMGRAPCWLKRGIALFSSGAVPLSCARGVR